MTPMEKLERCFARISALNDAVGLLSWDRDVMMPAGAGERRASDLATLEGLRHALLTAEENAALLVEADPGDDPWRRANLAEMRRQHARAVAVPGRLVEALSEACSKAEMTWRAARQASDFAALRPALEEVLALTREQAVAIGEALDLSPYDALLDGFDPGMREATITPIFAVLAQNLPPLMQKILARQEGQSKSGHAGIAPYPLALQEKLGRTMMARVGFDTQCGRLDVSAHPFCGGAIRDVRITTRYDEMDFLPAFLGAMHETGHALYEQGLPKAWEAQPVGAARGMTLHESQSLLLEMQVTRSEAFAKFAAPLMQKLFGDNGDWKTETLHRQMTQVKAGFIRVDADEVTYPAHIIARYDLERAMIGGQLAVRDLPEAFNARIKELLGIDVPEDRLGCLQDIHWPLGLWGYFPCYALGALTAAQLYEAAGRAVPGLEAEIGTGNLAPLLGWLREKVHARASSVSTMRIIEDATGRPLGAEAYLAHIRRRYLDEVA
ncbi:carboxypeptidase [Acetobacter estunensis NRIC 0472]|uniref:Metal-dependent carboxypeptidase n=1 Tax=Acetobacter estunensis TaxID=104097 RepID=A0A967EIF4_9PROT|nr:carboxypeptidase M32 [Acetobacter estunensis]NHO55372.1 carboxypeptidase M32 [Acetobacter estunensis]GBQ26509.1 carboxypeptidase [Acetobacter estunensis NRIC 0472]